MSEGNAHNNCATKDIFRQYFLGKNMSCKVYNFEVAAS